MPHFVFLIILNVFIFQIAGRLIPNCIRFMLWFLDSSKSFWYLSVDNSTNNTLREFEVVFGSNKDWVNFSEKCFIFLYFDDDNEKLILFLPMLRSMRTLSWTKS